MSKAQLQGGKVLLAGGKVAIDPACCCSGAATSCPGSVSGCPGTQVAVVFPAGWTQYNITIPVSASGGGFGGTAYYGDGHGGGFTVAISCSMVGGVPCWMMALQGALYWPGGNGCGAGLYECNANPAANVGCGDTCPPRTGYAMSLSTICFASGNLALTGTFS